MTKFNFKLESIFSVQLKLILTASSASFLQLLFKFYSTNIEFYTPEIIMRYCLVRCLGEFENGRNILFLLLLKINLQKIKFPLHWKESTN